MIPSLQCFCHPEKDIIMVNLAKDVKRQHRTLCPLCMEETQFRQLCSIENIPLMAKEFAKNELDQLAEQYHPLIERISQIRKSVVTLRDKSDKMCKNVIQVIDDLSLSFNMELDGEYIFIKDAVQDISRNKLEDLGDILSGYKIREVRKNKPDVKLIELENTFSLHFKSYINELKLTLDQIVSMIQVQKISQEILKPIPYQLTDYKVKQEGWCRAIAFNNESTVMVAGCNSQIKVFQFKLGQLKQIQFLSGHTQLVTVLYFMKKLNEFLSGSDDKSIRIWGINNNQQWYCKQQLLKDGHTDKIRCVIMNGMEDLIISGSNDKSIKFWIKKNEWECSQTLTEHTGFIQGICLNDSQNQLASCACLDNRILLSQLDSDTKWKVVQQISVNWGRRLCFVGDNLITFQPDGEKMEILELNKQTKQFVKSKEMKVGKYKDGCMQYFPQAFNKQKQILLTKNGETVYVMRKQNDADFVIDYKQQFGTEYVFGAMTNDAEYLVTCDGKSCSFKVVRQQQ